MRDCTACKFDVKGSCPCAQGHFRTGGTVPIEDCHAWKEKECGCKDIRWSSGMVDLFDIVCKRCGRKFNNV